jgi:hypothetical protein
MKQLLFPIAFAALFAISCANDNTHSDDATHMHDDGSVHENHADSTHDQEEFEVDGDSTEVGHSHDDGSHSH